MMTSSEMAERRLAAQYELSRVLASEATLEAAAPRVLEIIGKSVGCVASEMWIFDPSTRSLRLSGAWSMAGESAAAIADAARGRVFLAGEGLPGLVLSTGEPRWIRDVREDPDFRRREQAASIGLCTAIAFPIQFAGTTTGVIQFFDRSVREPDRALLDVFADVGSQLGLFLERVQMSALIRRQHGELLEVSMPVLRIWDGVLLAPMIGTLDETRASEAMNRIVEAVVDTGARTVLVDVTGVPHLDTAITKFVLDTIRAARLVGAQVVLTGVRPALAQTLVRIGVRLDDVTATGTLADGLSFALRAAQRPRA